MKRCCDQVNGLGKDKKKKKEINLPMTSFLIEVIRYVMSKDSLRGVDKMESGGKKGGKGRSCKEAIAGRENLATPFGGLLD